MRAEVAEADRWQQVREAAQGWQRAGAIDRATLSGIQARYPDDRARLGPVFRVLVFGFTKVAVSALLGLFMLVLESSWDPRGPLLLFGLALVAATEYQMGPLRRAQGGAESATAVLAVGYLLVGLVCSARLAPAHRRCCQAAAVLGLVFLYLAVHLGSWDVGVVERVSGEWNERREPSSLRVLFIAATALVPVLTLGWGIHARRRLLINLGLVGLLASIVTLRFYVQVAPLWLALVLGGGVAIGLALALRRHLDSGPGHERQGFTAEPLFTDPEKRSALEIAAGMVSLSPGARPAPEPGFQGGGGRSGGGGATGTL